MATNQSSSSLRTARPKAQPSSRNPHTQLEQQLRCSMNAPQLLAAIEVLLPLAQTEYKRVIDALSSDRDPRIVDLMKSEAEAWALGISLAEDALDRIKPNSHLLARYLHHLRGVIASKQNVRK